MEDRIWRVGFTSFAARLLGDIATVNLVRNDYPPEISDSLKEPLRHGPLIINLRAEVL